MESWQLVRLDRDERYWKPGLPLLNRILARFIPDAATRSAVMETGEAHFAAYSAVNAADIKRMQASPILGSTTLGYGTTAATSVLEFDMRRPHLAKKEVRQAICYAIDRQFIADNILYGFAKPAVGPLSSVFRTSGFFTDDVRRFDVPDRLNIADRLIDEAGLRAAPSGVRVSAVPGD